MSDLKIQGVVEMVSTGAEQALDRIGDKADKMASEVAKGADKAGKAVDSIGDGAVKSADEFTRAEGKIVASIKRAQTQMEQLGKTASQKLELRINDRGLDPAKFEPMLAKLRELESAQTRVVGSSVGMRGGMQNLSYQMQDFIVQTNGGVSATMALSMQLPQLLGAFGAFGAGLGVVAALLPNLIAMFGDAGSGAKSLGDAMSDFDSSLSDVGRTVKSFGMEGLYEQFNGSSAVVRAATIEQVKFQQAFIETQRLVAQKAFGESLDGLGEYSTLNKLAGAFGASGAEKLGDQLGVSLDVAKDLLPVIKGLRDGTVDAGLAFNQFGTQLLGGNSQAIALAKSLSTLAGSEKDAYAASSALSEAQARMAGGHVTTKKEAEEAAKATKKLGDASKKAAEEAARNAAAFETLIEKLSGAALDEARKNVEDYNDAWADHLNGLDDERKGLEEQLELYGLTAAQIAAVNTQRAEERLEIAKRNGVSSDYLAALEREVELRRQIEKTAGSLEARKTADGAAKAAADEWQRTADSIEDALTDALMRGFESGKGFAENFRDTFANMFRTLILRPIIQPVTQGMAGAVMAPMGGLGFGGSGGSGGNGFSMPTTGIGSSGMISGLAGSAMLGGTSVGAFGAGMASGLASWTATGATVAGTAGAGAAAGGAVGAGMMVGAAIPIVGIALAILSAMDWGGGTPHAGAAVFAGPDGVKSPMSYAETESYYADPLDANGFGAKDFYKRREQGVADALSPVAEGAASILNGALAAFGQEAKYQVGLAFSADDDDASRGRLSIINNAGDEAAEFVRKYNKDPQQGFSEFAADLGGSLRDALVSADLPGWVDDILTSLGDAPSMEQLSAVMGELSAFVDGAMTQDDAWRKATESLSDQFDALGVSMPRSTQEFNALVQASGDLGAELYGLAPAFYQLASAVESTFAAISKTTAESVRDIELSVLDNAGKYAYLDTEIVKLIGQMETALDPATVQGLFEQINAKTVSAYNLLDEDMQRGKASEFIDRLYEAESIAQSRLSVTPLPSAASSEQSAAQAETAAAQKQAALDMSTAAKAMGEAAARLMTLQADDAASLRTASTQLQNASQSLAGISRALASEIG